MWTYAMAHFLERGNEKEIFEAIQACVIIFNPSIDVVSII